MSSGRGPIRVYEIRAGEAVAGVHLSRTPGPSCSRTRGAAAAAIMDRTVVPARRARMGSGDVMGGTYRHLHRFLQGPAGEFAVLAVAVAATFGGALAFAGGDPTARPIWPGGVGLLAVAVAALVWRRKAAFCFCMRSAYSAFMALTRASIW